MFEVIFEGKLAPGTNPEEVKAKIAALFKANDAQLARLFSGQRVVIKSGLDEATANKYRMAIEKAGALCEIASSQASASAPAPQPAATASMASVQQPDQTDGFDIAPVDAGIGEDKPFVPANINLDHLSTAEVGADLEQLKADVKPYELTAHFDVAEVGSDMDEMPRLEAPFVMSEEMDTVSIAEVGTALSDAKPVQAAVINELNVEIAPAGSDLGQTQKAPPPPPPDTDHLKIESE